MKLDLPKDLSDECLVKELISRGYRVAEPSTALVAWKHFLTHWPTQEITISAIQARVSDHYGIDVLEIIGKRKTAKIARARQVAMYLARMLTKATYAEIAQAFGGRDHATVIYSCRIVTELIQKTPSLRKEIQQLSQ